MDSLPVASPAADSGSRTASPVRPKALVTGLHPRHNVALSTTRHLSLQGRSKDGGPPLIPGRKRSDSAVMKMTRKKSPLPLRKLTGDGLPMVPSVGLSVGNLSNRPRAVSHTGSQEDGQNIATDDIESEGTTTSLTLQSEGSFEVMSGMSGDEVDGSNTPDIHRTRAAIEHTHQKIARTRELIKAEQTARDDNVNEYLKLASNADKQQLQRIKNVFEKKNQKAAQTISQLQKKLENYHKRIRELETYGVAGHRQPKEVLRDVGQGLKDVGANIRDGITGFSGSVMSKPREFAHLIKNKFGSADNINNMTKWFITEPLEEGHDDSERNHHGSATFTHSTGTKYTSEDDSSSITSGSGPTAGTGTMSSPRNHPQLNLALNQSLHSSSSQTQTLPAVLSSYVHPSASFLPDRDAVEMMLKLQERQEECQRLQEEVDTMKAQLQQEITYFHQALQEERYRYERLEEQMNDLIELHQNEIENLKQGINDMEEKVQYQSEERLRDMHELLENFHTKISRMEHQQQQQQQLVTLEGIENSNARALILKLINIVLTVLQVVLLLVATAANILMPFLRTRVRVFTTSLLVVIIVMMCRQWPEVVDFVHQLLNPLSRMRY